MRKFHIAVDPSVSGGSTVENLDNESDFLFGFTIYLYRYLSDIQLFHQPQKFWVCRKPGDPPIYNPPTRVRFLGFGVTRVFSKLSWLTSQELCKNVRWLYSKQSQTDDIINSGTLGKPGCTSIYLYAIHHWFKRTPLGLGPYTVVCS